MLKKKIIAMITAAALVTVSSYVPAYAEEPDADTGKAVYVFSGESVEKDSIASLENIGAEVKALGEEDASLTVNGDVSVNHSGTVDSAEIHGVIVQTGDLEEEIFRTGNASANVAGNVSASYNGAQEGYAVYGFTLDGDSTGSVSGKADSVTAVNLNGYAYGVNVNSALGEASLDIGTSISVDSNRYANGAFVYAEKPYDLNVDDSSSIARLNVGSNTMVKGGIGDGSVAAEGAVLIAGEGGEVYYEAQDFIGVRGASGAVGLYASAAGGYVEASVSGHVLAISSTSFADTPEGSSAEEGDAYGVQAYLSRESSDINVDVYGNITADGEKDAVGILVNGAESEGGYARIHVNGDVYSNKTGVLFDSLDQANADVLVNGTISGDERSVAILGGGDDTVTLTAWEIKTDENGAVAGRLERREDGTDVFYEDEQFEKSNIQYIIKVREGQEDFISIAGTTSYEEYNVAREGDNVILKLNIPVGYQVKRALNNEVELDRNADGEYYLTVPRGGGVELGLELEEIPEPEPEPEPEPKHDKAQYHDVTGKDVVVEIAKDSSSEDGSTIGAWFRITDMQNSEGLLNHFRELHLDQRLVPRKFYTVSEGSIIIEILQSYLNTLSAGEHILTVTFDNGDPLDIPFKVIEKEAESKPSQSSDQGDKKASNQSAKTGDGTHPGSLILLMAGSLFAAAYLMYRKKQKKED